MMAMLDLRPKRLLLALAKLIAVLLIAAGAYELGSAYADHKFGVVLAPPVPALLAA
jgi:hypothetical protein